MWPNQATHAITKRGMTAVVVSSTIVAKRPEFTLIASNAVLAHIHKLECAPNTEKK